MATPIKFKVWVHIERIDKDNDEYEDEGLPEPIDTFDSLEEAESLVGQIVDCYAV